MQNKKTGPILVLLISLMVLADPEMGHAQRAVVKTPRRTVVHSPRGTVVYRHSVVVRPIPRLPASAVIVHYHNNPYYFHAGVFYIPRAGAYIRVVPPAGIRLAVLPVGYRRIVIGSAAYFYYNGVFYTPVPGNEYVVVEAPVGAVVESIPSDAAQIELEGQKCVEYNGVIYRPIYRDGTKYYEVFGKLKD